MNTKSVFSFFYAAAAVFLVAWLIVTVQQMHHWGGWLLMLSLLSLAIAFRGHHFLKGFSYTVMIFAAVSLTMYYPNYFKTVGDFNLSGLIVPLLQLIMFGMGTELSLQDFSRIVQMPKGVVIGVVCHYIIMPFIGFGVANMFNFPPEIAAGIILVGCSPSGLASNVMCYLSRGNLALSVSVTTVSTLVAPLLTPLLMQLLGGSLITIHFLDMVLEMVKMVVIPVAAGIGVRYLLKGRVAWLNKVLPITSMIGIVLILVVIIAKGRDALLQVGGMIILATFIHNTFGYLLGYWSGRLFRFNERDSRTIALEVGMQNAGLASALASKISANPAVALAPAIFGPMMNITGSLLSSWWHNRVPKDDLQPDETTGGQKEVLKADLI
ncbi:bile acid:Na+ symporter, BASS family [Cnuella takakiae]|uniref:Bile acid:Na+ symporter, BASS family n=1 Tax=Cnuella takakiae TaxID=1302690 RepID=A0A1M4YXN7_9BACT|nr:bile acid:sodium symporter family protein [Cnuella takakiae]OLY94391.1 bile acid:sodium symporter [Cnuella takakiae]SHF10584.1 bile acid:Na+ symporter, BASS family [Cnuella takakiae]